MSKELVCPFCNGELETGNYYVHCHNPNCDITVEMEGTEEMWLALIRTRKALEISVEKAKALKELADIAGFSMFSAGCQDIIEQITALEQKDK